jgi:hypothetical protein
VRNDAGVVGLRVLGDEFVVRAVQSLHHD